AVVQAFFPGEEGAGAIAGVLSGRVNPSGKLPVSLPRSAGAQPYSYLHPPLGEGREVTNLASTPAAPFGHGLSYATFAHEDLTVPAEVATDGSIVAEVRVTNTGTVAGDDVVQLYGRDLIGSVTRPVAQLVGYRRVRLEPGESVTVTFAVPTTRLAFADRTMRRVVEPGDVDLWVGTSQHRDTVARTTFVGDVHLVSSASARWTVTEIG
ncbi:fibronectin type III-like domain-contianing protein, partial [Cellulomonas sp. P5_C6]